MHKTFISYHHSGEQASEAKLVAPYTGQNIFINKSVKDGDIDPNLSEDTIMRKIRTEFIQDSSVIIVLIGEQTAERPYVNSEIQAGLWGDNPVGLIGVVKDDLFERIYDKEICTYPECNCGKTLRVPNLEFEVKIPFLVRKNNQRLENEKSTYPHYSDSDAYCSIYKYSVFIKSIERYIDEAFNKRSQSFNLKKRNAKSIKTIINPYGIG